ncbi:nuclear transport factor 2-like [Bidens hawaiensis]|uniref:nuclear transport factor 2-like n=1 Tax=Bidens hawaiensis TaxID=980011 RepID=UPI0040490533
MTYRMVFVVAFSRDVLTFVTLQMENEMENGNIVENQTLSSENENDTVVNQSYSAQDVADAFAKQYYKILQDMPKEAYNFYKEQSVRAHPYIDGSMKLVTTLQCIDEEIMASNIKEWNPDLETIHAQDSVMNSVVVGVTGFLIDNNDVTKNFAQTFLLAPQEGGGFYVHNDFLQLLEIQKAPEASPAVDDVEDPLPAQQADNSAKDSSLEIAKTVNKDQTEKSIPTKEGNETKMKFSEVLEGKKPPPAEPKKKTQPSVWQTSPKIQEDSKKVSYASILAKEGSGSSTTDSSPKAVAKVSPKTDKRAITSAVVPKPPVAHNDGPDENIYDVKSIRVKDLPPTVTQECIHEVVKQFGPVKLKNVQIKEYPQDGYRYAFVEFDHAKSAISAVEARFIRLDDKSCEIQCKKHSNQGGNNMGRPPFGRRTENGWRREGEGSGGGSWGNKHVDHENFGQHSGQTRDYNQGRNRYYQDRR